MMRARIVIANVGLASLAVAAGWWARGAETPVLAQRSSTSSSSARGDANLAFQLVGDGVRQSLSVYNPENHTLYVYSRVNEGNSHLSCTYSFTITRPGAPIDRQNCPVGELMR